ncbi:MAG TPA: MFS transporter [Acidothermaceae bacterium]|nr:MFS transporter [Acidothermaceae bacterium]
MDLSGLMARSRLGLVFRTRGVPRLLGFALIAELPAGMTALAIVLRITQSGGTYARAGLVGAVGAVGVGVCAPVWSRLVDRKGQTVVLIPTAIAVSATGILLAVLPPRGAIGPLLIASTLMGLCQPPALVSARTLWPKVVTNPAVLETTYSIESSMTELVFIVGPLLAVAINAAFGSATAVAASGVLSGVGALGLASSRASRATRGTRKTATSHAALRSVGVRILVCATFTMVIGFAAIDVSVIATARKVAGNGAAGTLIAVWGIGSLLGGMAFGARSWPGRMSTRIVFFIGAITVFTVALIPVTNLVLLGVLLFVGGLNYAPCFSCINQVVQRIALPGAATESFAWITSGALMGAAAGEAAAGFAITHQSPHAGFAVATAALLLACIVVLIGRRSIRGGDLTQDQLNQRAGRTPSQIGSDESMTVASEPNTTNLSKERANQRS